jgi:hypothetical protein
VAGNKLLGVANGLGLPRPFAFGSRYADHSQVSHISADTKPSYDLDVVIDEGKALV